MIEKRIKEIRVTENNSIENMAQFGKCCSKEQFLNTTL